MRVKDVERFWSKVERKTDSDCLEWTGWRNKKGYGQFKLGGKYIYTHRFSWELENGEIPGGLFVLHRCDNPPCVNTRHLFLWTNADNMADMVSKGRQSKGEKRGLLFRGERNGCAKLNETAVRIIRTLYRDFEFKQLELANLYDVSQSLIHSVVNRKIWRHI